MIRCKSTGVEHRHETVTQVRNCYALEAAGGAAAMDLKTPEFVTAIQRKERAEAQLAAKVTEVGIYRKVITTKDATLTSIYRVRLGKSGHFYADALQLGAPGTKAKFIFAPGAIKILTANMRMTKDEAKKYGVQFGICCRCGKVLEKDKSVEAGIGPVCIKKF